jgi:hypothetical protein
VLCFGGLKQSMVSSTASLAHFSILTEKSMQTRSQMIRLTDFRTDRVVDPRPPLQTRRQSRAPQGRGTQVPHIFAEITVSTKYKRLKKAGGKASHKKEKERESRGGFHGLLARVGSCRSWDVKRVLRENEKAGISKG